ncbi:MAG: S-layer homology domain-containing protein [Oscillospiraceae bacterium]|nr:S-layer homology domain-containing protein [Oscillospiraceae bacterium]
MKRRILSLIMVLVMTIGFLPAPASAATYLDTRGNWAEEAIDRWSGYGVIQGNNGKFNPAGNLTRAHMAAILSRLLQLPEAASAGF